MKWTINVSNNESGINDSLVLWCIIFYVRTYFVIIMILVFSDQLVAPDWAHHHQHHHLQWAVPGHHNTPAVVMLLRPLGRDSTAVVLLWCCCSRLMHSIYLHPDTSSIIRPSPSHFVSSSHKNLLIICFKYLSSSNKSEFQYYLSDWAVAYLNPRVFRSCNGHLIICIFHTIVESQHAPCLV